MERFPDGRHVWLRRPLRGEYLFADDDGRGVSQRRIRTMLNAAWRVQRVVARDGTPCFLLQNAAYGRYLALSPHLAPHGHRGRPAMLCDFDEPYQRKMRWRAVAAGEWSDDVLLCTLEGKERYLRAEVSLSRTCSCVTVDSLRSWLAHWTVEQIPPRPAPPALPSSSMDKGGHNDWYRKIFCTAANDERKDKFRLSFHGRSIFSLRSLVAKEVNQHETNITLCLQAGSYGRLIPLVVDLPRSNEPLDIVVLPTSSEGAKRLVHPDIGGIELLTDGAFVHLACWVRGQCCYLHAQGDGVGVNLSPRPTSLHDVWGVHQIKIDGDEFLLFRSAAYGRYFALVSEEKKPRFAQVNYEDPEQTNLLWIATSLKESNEINLSCGNDDKGIAISWTVEAVPISPTPPHLPAPFQEKDPKKRLIWHRWGNDMPENHWITLVFYGRSLSALRSQLSKDNSIILCVRAGCCGCLTPLVTDLPNNDDTMEIMMLTPGSPAARDLRYPVVNPRGV